MLAGSRRLQRQSHERNCLYAPQVPLPLDRSWSRLQSRRLADRLTENLFVRRTSPSTVPPGGPESSATDRVDSCLPPKNDRKSHYTIWGSASSIRFPLYPQ